MDEIAIDSGDRKRMIIWCGIFFGPLGDAEGIKSRLGFGLYGVGQEEGAELALIDHRYCGRVIIAGNIDADESLHFPINNVVRVV